MLKILFLLGVFILIVNSGMIIKDWNNEDSVKILTDDEIDYDNMYFNPEDLQCKDPSNKLNKYQEKEMMQLKGIN